MNKPAYSKFHPDYWRTRVIRRQVTLDNGQPYESPFWLVRLSHLDRREYFNLNTANKDIAAAKAKDIYLELKVNGWEPVLKKYKVEALPRKPDPTIGEFFKALRTTWTGRERTLNTYIVKFRTLLSDCFNIPSTKAHFSTQEYQDRINAIDKIRFSSLTSSKIQSWKKMRLDEAGDGDLERNSARRTINSTLRGIKSLLAPKVAKHLSVQVDASFLEGIDMEYVPVQKYHSKIKDLGELLRDAKAQLGTEHYKAFLLALGAGLRRNEIDKLTWSQIDFKEACIRVESNEYASLKTASSEGNIDIDPDMAAIFKDFQAQAKSIFVIDSNSKITCSHIAHHSYRCARIFEELTIWLRGKGLNSRKPLHELRKEFGSLVCASSGIFAASRQLRHSNITLTNAYYLDRKERAVANLPLKPKAPPAEPAVAQISS